MRVDVRGGGVDLAAELAGTDYTHVRKLAEGGMGEVHVVRHGAAGEERVMKLVLPLPPDVAELVKKRTIAEGRMLRKLSHPHIVQLLDLGVTASGRPWLVTELLRGRTLKEEVDRGPMRWLEVVEILRDVLGALTHAHEQGLIHRDIKPLNIFLCDPDARGKRVAKILDFGIAKLLSDEAKQQAGSAYVATQEGYFVGSPTFMAPEQLGGDVTPMSDLYSLAGTGVYMLTRQYPFPGSTTEEVMEGHLFKPPPDVCAVRPDVPPSLGAWLRRALAKAPAERGPIPTMQAALEALLSEAAPPPLRRSDGARGTVRMAGSPPPPQVGATPASTLPDVVGVDAALAQAPAETAPMAELPAGLAAPRRTRSFEAVASPAPPAAKQHAPAAVPRRASPAPSQQATARPWTFERLFIPWGASLVIVVLVSVALWLLWKIAQQRGWLA